MVETNTYGIWEKTEDGYKKETESMDIHIQIDDTLYCMINWLDKPKTREYSKQTEDADKLASEIMKEESHGEYIIDVIESKDMDLI
jgi:hypothetical protein